MGMLKRIICSLLVGVSCLMVQAQLSTLLIRLIGPDSDQHHVIYLWKQMPDQSYKANAKQFSKQTMISLDPGKYIMSVERDDQPIFRDVLHFGDESCMVFNIYTKPVMLATANFDSLSYATPGMLNLITRRMSYMDF